MKIAIHCLSWTTERRIGAEVYLEEVALALTARGHEVGIFPKEIRYRTRTLSERLTLNPHGFEPDIVITNAGETGFARTTAVVNCVPLVCIVHSLGIPELTTAGYGSFDLVVVNSANTKRVLGNTLNPVMTLIPPVPAPLKKPKALGTKYLLVGTGVLKGGDVLTNIARYLPEEKFIGIDGGYGGAWRTPYPNIKYYPHQADGIPIRLWNETKALLVLSREESWSMVASEAISRGIPVIFFEDLKGVKENTGVAGVAVKRTIGGLAEGILSTLPTRREVLSQADHNHALHTKQLEAFCDRLEAIAV